MDDLISRAEALNLVKDVCEAILSGCGSHYDGEDEVFDDLLEADAILKCNKEIRTALKHLPSAHQWIPCAPDTMPKDDIEVIVSCTDDSGDYEVNYTAVGWYYKGLWVVDNERCLCVRAWKPMPRPWEEE